MKNVRPQCFTSIRCYILSVVLQNEWKEQTTSCISFNLLLPSFIHPLIQINFLHCGKLSNLNCDEANYSKSKRLVKGPSWSILNYELEMLYWMKSSKMRRLRQAVEESKERGTSKISKKLRGEKWGIFQHQKANIVLFFREWSEMKANL